MGRGSLGVCWLGRSVEVYNIDWAAMHRSTSSIKSRHYTATMLRHVWASPWQQQPQRTPDVVASGLSSCSVEHVLGVRAHRFTSAKRSSPVKHVAQYNKSSRIGLCVFGRGEILENLSFDRVDVNRRQPGIVVCWSWLQSVVRCRPADYPESAINVFKQPVKQRLRKNFRVQWQIAVCRRCHRKPEIQQKEMAARENRPHTMPMVMSLLRLHHRKKVRMWQLLRAKTLGYITITMHAMSW